MDWVPVAVAFAGGTALAKIIDVIYDRVKGATERRRTEVDRMARELKNAQRREHLALVFARRLELLAVRYGVPEDEMPDLDFKNNDEGVN